MFDSYALPRLTHRPEFHWQERFYEALLDGRDPRENCFAAESIIFARLNAGDTAPLSNEERSAMDDCLSDLRRFQVQELNYPPIEIPGEDANLLSAEEIIEDTFYKIVGRPMLLRERSFFLRKARVA
jgi:hypothetical protein